VLMKEGEVVQIRFVKDIFKFIPFLKPIV